MSGIYKTDSANETADIINEYRKGEKENGN